jgi:hypothetical protein
VRVCPDCYGRARIIVQGGPMRCPLCAGRGSVETRRDYPPLPVLGGGGPASARPRAYLQAGARLPHPMPPEADDG